jgi:ATP/maltotriose-dependent transcriptional regulator MalT
MLSSDQLHDLHRLLHERKIGAGISLLDANRSHLAGLKATDPQAGLAIGTLARWVDVGYDGGDLLSNLLARFPAEKRHSLPLSDYLHLRMAEAVAAMRRDDSPEALDHLRAVLVLEKDMADPRIAVIAGLWKARCLRKSGEYDQALEITRESMKLAAGQDLSLLAAILRTLESWMLFQKGDSQEAVRILQEAEAALRDTDDFITLGNIQSAYGRIALREGRYDHAMQYFEASIELFRKRTSLEGYLARSLTNMAQAKRFLALQLRRSIDAKFERQRLANQPEVPADKKDKAGQMERMYELLRTAQENLAKADEIYRRRGNHHGTGNVDVNYAQICIDLGELDLAEKRAAEAFDLGAAKADYLLMCRARIVQATVSNARFEEQIGEADDPSRFAQLAHDCAKEAVALGERTESRRLLAQAYICQGLTLVNGFFNNIDGARACCDQAETYLNHDRHDALWQEVEILRSGILHAGLEDPNLRAWSQGAVGDKSLQQVVADFEEVLIRRVWEREGKKVSRVAHKLAVSPKKVRRVLRHLGLLEMGPP